MTGRSSDNYELRRRPDRGWLKRIVTALLLAPIIFYGAWFWQTSSAWNAELARLKAAGEWTSVDDLNNRPDITGSNYAEPVLRALSLLKTETPEARIEYEYEFPDDHRRYPLTDRAKRTFSDYVSSNSQALIAFDEARGRTQVDWNRTYASPLQPQIFPDYSVRRVATVALEEAMLKFDSGEHAKAFQRWEQILELGDRYYSNRLLIDYLIANGIQQMVICELRETAASLRIGEGENEVPRERVETMIVALLDHQIPNDRFAVAIKGNRVEQFDIFRNFPQMIGADASGKPTLGTRLFGWMFLPVSYGDMTLISKRTDELISLKSVTTSAEAKLIQKASLLNASFESKRHLLANLFAGTYGSIVTHKFRDRASRDLAAIALAARLYAIDHGRLPETLDALTPIYLPQIPIDPFSGKPYRYVNDPTEPRIYSFGMDETDDGGVQPLNGEHKNTDFVTYLIPQPARLEETIDEFEQILRDAQRAQ